MSKTNLIVLKKGQRFKEYMSDIMWCKSVFDKYAFNMEDNFMNEEVSHAYHLVNIIRIKAKDFEEVYDEALKVVAYYGDLLYGKDIRMKHWRVQRLIEQGYAIEKADVI